MKKISEYDGDEQNVKMELMGMVEEGADPFDIIIRLAKYLEKVSEEPGYAAHLLDNMRAVYGLALGEKKPLTAELAEVRARTGRIEAALNSEDFTDDERKRINFALEIHRAKVKRLEERLRDIEAGREPVGD